MIKISANISKKVPIPAKDFSSQAFGASLEIEVSDADKPNAIQARLRELYGLLSNTIDEQIAAATNARGDTGRTPAQQAPASAAPINGNRSGYSNGRATRPSANGNGNVRKTTATEAQQRAIFAICKSLNLDMAALLADYNVSDPSQLHVKTASQLIDELKSRQNGNGSPTSRQ